MRLLDLQPEFLTYWEGDDCGRHHVFHRHVDSIAEADGVMFLCPRCFREHNGSTGTHSIICWSPRIPQSVTPGPGRWDLVGTGLHDLSLVAGSSSIQLQSGCRWHGFVRNGEVTDA